MAPNFGFLEKAERRQKRTLVPISQIPTKNSHPEKWLSCVQTILIECGIPGAYHFIENVNEAHFKEFTKKKLQDVAIQQWITSMKNNHSAVCMQNINTNIE